MRLSKYSKPLLLCMSAAVLFCSTACKSRDEATFDIRIFEKTSPVDVVHINLTAPQYEGGFESTEDYKLYFYQESADFTNYYPDAQFVRKEFDCEKEYRYLTISEVYKNYLYFHSRDEEKADSVFRYDITDGTEETVFTYDGENQISIAALNDKYIIWKEDENANWLRASLNCYDIEKGKNTKFFTYSRDENDFMYSWNFDDIVLDGDHVYFDNVESKENNKSNMNLYDYNIADNTLNLVAEKRAAQPISYNGISWLGYDEINSEYILQNKSGSNIIRLGPKHFNLFSSKNIIVGQSNKGIDKDGIMYFDGKKSYPVLQSTNNIDMISCTDDYIAWNGWSSANPLFYDIKSKMIIRVDCLEQGLAYKGYVGDEYLVFEAHEYVHDPEAGESAVKTKSLIYYFVKTSELD